MKRSILVAIVSSALALSILSASSFAGKNEGEIVVRENKDGTFSTIRDPDGDGQGYVTSGGHKTRGAAEREARKQNRQLRKIEKDKKKDDKKK